MRKSVNKHVSVSIPSDLILEIDRKRGDVSRSRFFLRMLEKSRDKHVNYSLQNVTSGKNHKDSVDQKIGIHQSKPVWNNRCGLHFGWSIFWTRFYKCLDKFWVVSFNFRDLFFIRYYRQKDNHYEIDLIPVFEQWRNQDTNLDFHVSIRAQSFHNMFLNMIHNMHFVDSNSVARDHLYSYHYSDNRSFEQLQKNIGIYNNMVGSFINGFTDDIEIFLKTELPQLRQYRHEEDPQSNFYHYSSIIYYFWLVYWQSRDGKQEIRLEVVQYGNSHHLRIGPSGEPIASATDKDDIIELRTFMTNEIPNVIFRLTRLNEYRSEAIEQYMAFGRNIRLLLQKQAWTRPLKGRCKWEQQYFSIRDKE